MSKVTSGVTPSPETITPSEFLHQFRWQGRRYTLRKREQSKASPWYFQGMIDRKRFNHSLDTPVATVAQERAILNYIKPAREGRFESGASAMKSNPMLVGELVDAWEVAPAERSPGYVRRAGLSLLRVLRRAGFERPRSCRLAEVLVPESVERWRAAVLGECQGLSQGDQSRVKRSANSEFNTARCLLAPGALGDYQAAGLKVPDPREFLAAFERRKFRRVAKEVAPLDRSQMRRVIRLLVGAEDLNVRRAVLLALGFGLRIGEIAQARWEGLRLIDDGWWWDQAAVVKKGSGRLVVRGVDPWVRVLRGLRAGAAPGDFVLQGNVTERGDDVFRRIGVMMREAGWEEQKTNHALRAFAGGEVALKYGVYQCQGWLRHASIQTTEKHYTRQWLESAGAPPRIAWAKSAA